MAKRSTAPRRGFRDPLSEKNPWVFLEVLDEQIERFPGLDVGMYEGHFLDLVSQRPSEFERDTLIAKGQALFAFQLAQTLRAVEIAVLNRIVTLPDRPKAAGENR